MCIYVITFTGRQVRMRKRSIDAKLPRKVLVGDLNEFFMTVRMMRMLPTTPRIKVILKANIRMLQSIQKQNLPINHKRW